MAELLSDHREHEYLTMKPDVFYLNINLAKDMAKKFQTEITKYFPKFLNEFEDSGAFQELLYLQDKYKKELKEVKKQYKGNKPLNELSDDSLVQFYKIFDDKTQRLDKRIYHKIKSAIEGRFIADLETLYHTYDLPDKVKIFIESYL